MKQVKKSAIFLMFLVSVTGCATNMGDVTDDNALTMKEIYDGSFNGVNLRTTEKGNEREGEEVLTVNQRKKNEGSTDLTGYTLTANNETQVLFKRIENPILVGYVFAHLTKDNIPIPSYSIPFRMSPKDYYAMPGEDQSF